MLNVIKLLPLIKKQITFWWKWKIVDTSMLEEVEQKDTQKRQDCCLHLTKISFFEYNLSITKSNCCKNKGRNEKGFWIKKCQHKPNDCKISNFTMQHWKRAIELNALFEDWFCLKAWPVLLSESKTLKQWKIKVDCYLSLLSLKIV